MKISPSLCVILNYLLWAVSWFNLEGITEKVVNSFIFLLRAFFGFQWRIRNPAST